MTKYFIATSLLLFFTSCGEDSSNSNTNSTQVENTTSMENENIISTENDNTLDYEQNATEISQTTEQEVEENILEPEISEPENSETEIDNGDENTNTQIVNDGDTNIIVNGDSENSQTVINTETEENTDTETEIEKNTETENSTNDNLENTETETETEENIETENSTNDNLENTETENSTNDNLENTETENSTNDNLENTETATPENYDLKLVGDTIIFGSSDENRVLEIENGYFPDIEYSLPISLSALNISMEFQLDNPQTVTLFFKLDEVGTNRNFVFLVPEMSLDIDGKLSGGSKVLLFGTRSDNSTVILSKPLNDIEIVSNENGETEISMSKVMGLFPEEIGSISSFIKANTTLNVEFGVSGISSFQNSLSLYEEILDGYAGDTLILLKVNLTENQTFGFSGKILILE
ncbi:hypothetical protein ThvES_00009020 [Thiovulum sp. ES]|nr:hypothetical protein ThvES_00009020 [Thiovulum sp. ES]